MGYSCRYVQDFQNRTNESNRIKAGLGFTHLTKKNQYNSVKRIYHLIFGFVHYFLNSSDYLEEEAVM